MNILDVYKKGVEIIASSLEEATAKIKEEASKDSNIKNVFVFLNNKQPMMTADFRTDRLVVCVEKKPDSDIFSITKASLG